MICSFSPRLLASERGSFELSVYRRLTISWATEASNADIVDIKASSEKFLSRILLSSVLWNRSSVNSTRRIAPNSEMSPSLTDNYTCGSRIALSNTSLFRHLRTNSKARSESLSSGPNHTSTLVAELKIIDIASIHNLRFSRLGCRNTRNAEAKLLVMLIVASCMLTTGSLSVTGPQFAVVGFSQTTSYNLAFEFTVRLSKRYGIEAIMDECEQLTDPLSTTIALCCGVLRV
ncbi:hypothetical protein KCU99_g92, partial [Aureobasidium melanogenum]